jgi:DNA polymerase III alpha subunit
MWLKTHYPVEYIYSLLKNEDERDKVTTLLIEAKRLGVEVSLPDVNESDISFSLKDNKIRFGLGNIKSVGKVSANEVIANQPYTSLEDLLLRVSKKKCNSRVIESLTSVGALECLGLPPGDDTTLFELLGIPTVLYKQPNVKVPLADIHEVERQPVFVRGVVKSLKKFSERTRLVLEDLTGFITCYTSTDIKDGRVIIGLVSGTDLVGYTYEDEYETRMNDGLELSPFEKLLNGKSFEAEKELYNHGIGKIGDEKALVIPLSVRTFKTRKGDWMARMVVSDGDSMEDIVVFPRQYSKVAALLHPFLPICIKTQYTKDGSLTVADNGIIPAERLLSMKGAG